MQTQGGFGSLNHDQILNKIHQIINTQVQCGIDNAHSHKSGLMKVEVEGEEEEEEEEEEECENVESYDEDQCGVCDYDWDTGVPVNLVEHVAAGYTG